MSILVIIFRRLRCTPKKHLPQGWEMQLVYSGFFRLPVSASTHATRQVIPCVSVSVWLRDSGALALAQLVYFGIFRCFRCMSIKHLSDGWETHAVASGIGTETSAHWLEHN